MESIRLSKYFTLYDLIKSPTASECGFVEQFYVPEEVIKNLEKLCKNVLDKILEKFPDMQITSGYRCKRLNKKVGGVKNSQHIKGEAADLIDINFEEMWNFIQTLEFDQLIFEQDHIHVSYRELNNRHEIIINYMDYLSNLKKKSIKQESQLK